MAQSIPVAGRGRRRTKPTKRGASTLAGLDQWSGLFDRCYLDHCCEAIARAVRGEIGAEDMAGTIRQLLIAPLDSYISDEAAAGRFASTNVSAAHRRCWERRSLRQTGRQLESGRPICVLCGVRQKVGADVAVVG